MRYLTINIAALLLASCGGEASAPRDGAGESGASQQAAAEAKQRILAFGNSLFAGYNLEEDEGYPERLQLALRERGLDVEVIDSGVSGDTSAAGLQRLEFVLDNLESPPDLVLVELGGNDLLRGISPAETYANLSAILTELRERDIPVLLMGMRAPPNLGAAFVDEFDAIYPELASRYDASLVPFFLEAVYDRPNFIQSDRVHPTARGIDAIVASTVDEVAAALPRD